MRAVVLAFGALMVVSGILGFYLDVMSSGAAPWLFWIGGIVVVATILWVVLPPVVRIARKLYVQAKRHDELTQALAGWQERAESAEEKLANWRMESVAEGRRRATQELAAALAGTQFGDTEVALADGEAIIAARRRSGSVPPVGAIFMIRGTLMPDTVLCTLRCVDYNTSSDAVVFRVDTYRGLNREAMEGFATSSRVLPSGMRIVARSHNDDFEREV